MENVQQLTPEMEVDNLDDKELTTQELTRKVLDLVEYMARRQAKVREEEFDKETVSQPDQGEMQWHCYICGYSWGGHDKINPEPPRKCANQTCKRTDYNKISMIGSHDSNCEKCRKKLERLAKELEAAKNRISDSTE